MATGNPEDKKGPAQCRAFLVFWLDRSGLEQRRGELGTMLALSHQVILDEKAHRESQIITASQRTMEL